jgi:hypothetical protein
MRQSPLGKAPPIYSDEIRRAAGAGAGDHVDLVLEADYERPEPPIPGLLAEPSAS